MRKKAVYRRVEKYYKTSEQYWKERDRRGQVLKLCEEGLTQKQIAERLGVTTRTVKRDFAKIKPYYMRKIRHYQKILQEEGDREFEKFKDANLFELLGLLEARVMLLQKLGLLRKRVYRCHRLNFILDLNFANAVDGYPKVTIVPNNKNGNVKFDFPLKISVFGMRGKNMVELGRVILNKNKPKYNSKLRRLLD